MRGPKASFFLESYDRSNDASVTPQHWVFGWAHCQDTRVRNISTLSSILWGKEDEFQWQYSWLFLRSWQLEQSMEPFHLPFRWSNIRDSRYQLKCHAQSSLRLQVPCSKAFLWGTSKAWLCLHWCWFWWTWLFQSHWSWEYHLPSWGCWRTSSPDAQHSDHEGTSTLSRSARSSSRPTYHLTFLSDWCTLSNCLSLRTQGLFLLICYRWRCRSYSI